MSLVAVRQCGLSQSMTDSQMVAAHHSHPNPSQRIEAASSKQQGRVHKTNVLGVLVCL